MSGGRHNPPQLDRRPQNRDSHINLSLIGRGRTLQTSGTSRKWDLPSGSTKASTTTSESSAQLNDAHLRQQHTVDPHHTIGHVRGGSTQSHSSWLIKRQSPWTVYEKGYELKFDQYVTVAARRAPDSGIAAIKTITSRDANLKLGMLRRVCNKRFVRLLEVFDFDGEVFAVFEHTPTSLKQVVDSAAYPTELQLVAILAQIIEGLQYLCSIGLWHGSLTCASMLIWPDGEIKIGSQECCIFKRRLDSSDISLVGYITMELMQKYAKEDGAIGVDDLNRWPADSEATKFLSMTTSANHLDELAGHSFLQNSWRKEDLTLLVDLASVTPRRAYRYQG